MLRKILIILITIIVPIISAYSKQCIPDKNYYDNNEPEKFNSSNNALRSQGDAAALSSNHVIQLIVTVIDKNCVPVKDANVRIWHKNSSGYYPYKMFRNRANNSLAKPDSKGSFQGSASCVTDNSGRCIIITTKGYEEFKNIMAITFRVEREDIEDLQTLKYLAVNSPDKNSKIDSEKASPKYELVHPDKSAMHIQNFGRYYINLTLPEQIQFKSY